MAKSLLLILVMLTASACEGPTAPSPVCTTELHALNPVVQATPVGYILLDSGPLTPVQVCRRP